jgi:uncharacterized membrane-anchored protein YitT (DUF2179 family)
VIDALYTSYQKLAAFIVTAQGDQVIKALHQDLIRGITKMPAKGGYSQADLTTLMIVISRYELYELQTIVHQTDANTLINLMTTVTAAGDFADQDRQLKMKNNHIP